MHRVLLLQEMLRAAEISPRGPGDRIIIYCIDWRKQGYLSEAGGYLSEAGATFRGYLSDRWTASAGPDELAREQWQRTARCRRCKYHRASGGEGGRDAAAAGGGSCSSTAGGSSAGSTGGLEVCSGNSAEMGNHAFYTKRKRERDRPPSNNGRRDAFSLVRLVSV